MAEIEYDVATVLDTGGNKWGWRLLATLSVVALLGGYMRFELGWDAARLLGLAVWASLILLGYQGVVSTRALRERIATEPGGMERLMQALTEHRRREWAELEPLGLRGYIRHTAPRKAWVLWLLVYGLAILVAPAAAPEFPNEEWLSPSLIWLAVSALVSGAVAIAWGVWGWRRAVSGWAMYEKRQSAA